MSDPPQEATALFNRLAEGDNSAAAELLPLVYAELRQLAGRRMARERADHTLQPTALVNEALLRMLPSPSRSFNDRAHFFRAAAQAMRAVLVDHARARGAAKRGGDRQRLELDQALVLSDDRLEDVLFLDEALGRLIELDEELGRVVELRFFAGLTHEEIAGVLGKSTRSIERAWRTARAWLRAEYSQD